MPFYDLRCAACDKEFNISASVAEKTEKRVPCPDCGSVDLESVYKSAPAYIKNLKSPSCPNRSASCGGCRHTG